MAVLPDEFRLTGAPFIIGTAGPTVLPADPDWRSVLAGKIREILDELTAVPTPRPSPFWAEVCRRVRGLHPDHHSSNDPCRPHQDSALCSSGDSAGGLIFNQLPGLGKCPILVLSSLASGADTFIAETVREWCEGRGQSFRLVAALPFPPEVYMQVSSSFDPRKHPDAAAEFRRLTSDRQNVFTVRCTGEDHWNEGELAAWILEACEGQTPAASAARTARYELAAGFVASFCDLLIAVGEHWELSRFEDKAADSAAPPTTSPAPGEELPKESGTSRCIAARLHGEVPAELPFAPRFSWIDAGPVAFIPITRVSESDTTPATPEKIEIEFPFRRRKKVAAPTAGTAPDPTAAPAEKAADTAQSHAKAGAGEKSEAACAHERSGLQQLGAICRRLRCLHEKLAVHSDCEKSFRKGIADCTLLLQGRGYFLDAAGEPETISPAAFSIEDIISRLPTPGTDMISGALRSLVDIHVVRARISKAAEAPSHINALARKALFVTVGVGAALAHLYGHGHGWSHTVLVFFLLLALGCALAAWLGHIWFSISGNEQDAHDLRAISEGLRVQAAWAAAGIPRSVASCYLHRFHSEMDWIRGAVSGFSLPFARWRVAFDSLPPSVRIAQLRAVVTAWLGTPPTESGNSSQTCPTLNANEPDPKPSPPQRPYFADQAKKRDDLNHQSHLRSKWCTLCGVAILGLLLLWELFFHHPHPGSHSTPEAYRFTLIAAGVLILAGALLHAHGASCLHVEHARRYSGMAHFMDSVVHRIHQLLTSAQDHADLAAAPGTAAATVKSETDAAEADIRTIQDLLEEIGRECLAESAGWLDVQRARPIDIPPAG